MPHRLADVAARHPLPERSRAALPWGSFAGYLAAAVAVVLVALLGWASHANRLESTRRVAQTASVIEALQSLVATMTELETGQRGFLLTGEARYLEPYDRARAALPTQLGRLRGLLADSPAQLERMAELARLVDDKAGELAQTVELQRRGQADAALATVRTDRGKAAMDRLRVLGARMLDDERALQRERQRQRDDAAAQSLAVQLGGGALLLALIGAAAAMGARDFRAREDEAWLRAAQGVLAQRLQGEHVLDLVAARVLDFLTRATGAVVGALYVAEADGSLRLAGGHAVDTTRLPARLQPGEGLAGQAMARREPQLLTGLPPDTLQGLPARSALGSAPAQALAIAPAAYDGRLQAVVELGFVGPPGALTAELLGRVSELVAVAVGSSRDRAQLESLLEETQRQAEELQAQQEELRVSNEELDEQGRALRESQAELEAQQTELERSNTQLAKHAATLEQQQHGLLRAQAELQAQTEALASASRYKSEFLANMSHELRTPLNSALILAQLLIENKPGTLTPEQVRYAQSIRDANNDLLALINDVLDLAKIEAGHADLRAERVPLAELAQRLVAMFEPLAQQRSLGFAVRLAPGAPAAVETDGQRLAQVLKNLLSNALKFTARGEVEAVFGPAPDGGVRIDVRDTGMGIPADKHELIFEAFRQADGSTSRQFGGTGLGLSISRELVQRMGGTLTLLSAPGEGSTFSVGLPAVLPPPDSRAAAGGRSPARAASAGSPASPASPAPAAAAAGPAAPRPPRRSERRLLLAVEDDSRFAAVLGSLVDELGFDCVVAGTGEEALALARELAPAGILLDVGLPDQSGLAVLEQLKRDAATRHIPVHVVSSYERSQAALEMGAIGHLVKPVGREALVEALRRLERTLDQPLRRVLVVEDDAALRDSLRTLLAAPQVEIACVGGVGEALRALASTTYDCMVTDLALPDGSGFDLLERMSAAEAGSFPPVIVYTGRALSRDEETRLRRHSRSIIVKGARSPERLLDEVTLFLHSVESRLPLPQRRLLDEARTRDSVLAGRSILLAEDDVRNIFALASVFEPLGVELVVARNGREALDKLFAQPAIDLVLMDVMMPEMDGLEAMRRIRQRPEFATLPIVALTAKAMDDDRRQCLAAGANDYLAKPIDVTRLLSLCRVWMPK